MEKTISPDERIRRAEEIYYRRKMQNSNRQSARVNVSNKKNSNMLKKMILQIAISILIYSIFYLIQNTNYIFSEDVVKKINEILSYDINIKHLYEQGMQHINSFIEGADTTFNSTLRENIIQENTINDSGTNETLENTESTALYKDNIGGEDVGTQEVILTEMEKDAKYVLENKSLVIPLKGTITSRFGVRDPKTPTVPKNHTGIDIAVNEGTVFNAAMEGVVQGVSTERRFGKSF